MVQENKAKQRATRREKTKRRDGGRVPRNILGNRTRSQTSTGTHTNPGERRRGKEGWGSGRVTRLKTARKNVETRSNGRKDITNKKNDRTDEQKEKKMNAGRAEEERPEIIVGCRNEHEPRPRARVGREMRVLIGGQEKGTKCKYEKKVGKSPPLVSNLRTTEGMLK